MWRTILKGLYLLSWFAVFGIGTFVFASWIAHILQERLDIDDDWSLFIWPIGSGIGIWFALRSLDWRIFHYVCLLFGGAAGIACGFMASHFSEKSERMLGLQGLMSGFGEGLMAVLFTVLGVVAVTMAVGCAAIIIRRWLTES